ncbi:Putative leucine-rich repeat receptor-like serine/threonine-protein kinase At2g24130 [Linum perenne]
MGYLKSAIFITFLIISVSGEESFKLSNQRAALLTFKSGVVLDPEGFLDSWKVSSPVCNWTGVECSSSNGGKGSRQIVQIDLSGMSLHGTISPSLSNISSLLVLDLSRNFFRGRIPSQLGHLSQLRQLSLSWNLLEGGIPSELGFLRKLVYIDLGSNKLFDEMPESLFCNGSSELEYVDLSNNSLSGGIGIPLNCELVRLRFLLLWSNKLVGSVPSSLAKSADLEWLDLESNMLSGELPVGIVSKMPKLQFLYLSYNHFVTHDGNTNLEPFLSALVRVCSKLEELELAGNNLGGKIPPIIGNLSKNLVQIHLDQNLLSGFIPPQISNLVNLTLLNLSSNYLDGTIPIELCRMVKLERIYLSNNSISGGIPECFGGVSHLGLLDLSKNKLSGSIPDSFANLQQLRTLLLYENQLSGTIPRSLGECMNLEILDLSRNEISGMIPGEVAGLRSLKLYLNLSSNHLDGRLPLELSKMDMVLAIDLSSNNLSSTIPSQLGSCIALEYLNLSGNSFRGALPDSIGKLPYLKELDVSSNQLNGSIPETLQTSATLKQLNFSFNMFSGNVSNKGAFSSLTMQSFLGNHGVCGTIKGMHSCKKRHSYNSLTLPLVVSLFAVLSLCMFVYRSFYKSSKFGIFDQDDPDDEEKVNKNDLKYPRISYRQLIQATGGLCSSNLIGSGRFGKVYKGVLQDNTRIAVKVLDPKTAGEMIKGSFKRECQVLRRTRHRNLIRIITSCDRPNFKALVFPQMSNGSLERHLYPSHGLKPGLNLVQLISICHDVAEGLAYLHHHSPVRVVHCDLKPSNILLDDDLKALVTDFGIAKLVNDADELKQLVDDSVSFESTDGFLCGSFGYIAPEYGMGKDASTQGDVYSYGVILLEIVTGTMPTDVLFHQGSNLHEWVKSHYPNKLEHIVEQAIVRYVAMNLSATLNSVWKDAILELIDVGLMCTQYNPSSRPTMVDVANEMGKLKDYVTSPPSLVMQGTHPKSAAE